MVEIADQGRPFSNRVNGKRIFRTSQHRPLSGLTIAVVTVIVVVLGPSRLIVAVGGVFDERVDDVVLHGVHHQRENEHDKDNLMRVAVLGPTQRPVTNPDDPGKEREDGEDAKLHAEQADEVEDALLEPLALSRRLAVVTRLKRLGWVLQRRVLG